MTARKIFDFTEAWKWAGGLEPGPLLIDRARAAEIIKDSGFPLRREGSDELNLMNWTAWRVLDLAQALEPGLTDWEIEVFKALKTISPKLSELVRSADATQPIQGVIQQVLYQVDTYANVPTPRLERKRGAPPDWRRQEASICISKLYWLLACRPPADTFDGPFDRFSRAYSSVLARRLDESGLQDLADFCDAISRQKADFWHARRFKNRAEAVAYLEKIELLYDSLSQ